MSGQEERSQNGLDEAWIRQAEEIELESNDRGALRAWIGESLPPIELPSVPGSTVNLAAIADLSPLILCMYSDLGGVRAKRWGDYTEELEQAGYCIFALSSETSTRQREWASSAELPYPVVSDREFQLARLLGLPTLEIGAGIRVYKNLTLVTHGVISRVFYPLENPKNDAASVTSWVRRAHAPTPGARASPVTWSRADAREPRIVG
jgi:peroxiredoxin